MGCLSRMCRGLSFRDNRLRLNQVRPEVQQPRQGYVRESRRFISGILENITTLSPRILVIGCTNEEIEGYGWTKQAFNNVKFETLDLCQEGGSSTYCFNAYDTKDIEMNLRNQMYDVILRDGGLNKGGGSGDSKNILFNKLETKEIYLKFININGIFIEGIPGCGGGDVSRFESINEFP